MKGIQIFNLVCLVVCVMGAIGAICGVIAGNWAHFITLSISYYFAGLFWTDEDGQESLKDYFKRKLTRNTHKTA